MASSSVTIAVHSWVRTSIVNGSALVRSCIQLTITQSLWWRKHKSREKFSSSATSTVIPRVETFSCTATSRRVHQIDLKKKCFQCKFILWLVCIWILKIRFFPDFFMYECDMYCLILFYESMNILYAFVSLSCPIYFVILRTVTLKFVFNIGCFKK